MVVDVFSGVLNKGSVWKLIRQFMTLVPAA